MRLLPLLCALLAVPAFAQPTGLLLYAPLDGSSDAAYALGEGRQQGGLLGYSNGVRGQAGSVTTDLLYATAGNFRTEEGSIAFWLRPQWDGSDPVVHHLFCLYGQRDLPTSYAVNRFNLTCGGGNLTFSIFTKEPLKSVGFNVSVGTWKQGEWHHLVATWSGINSGQPNAEMHLYLDGTLAGKLTGKQLDLGPSDALMAFGRDQDASPDYANADFDEVFVYGRALTETEITEGFKAAQTLPYQTAVAPPRTATPASWWNGSWPFRARVVLPPAEQERPEPFLQCPVRTSDLPALGLPGTVDMSSVRVLADGGKEVLPARIEDNLVQWRAPGVIPAGASRRFWLYFLTINYTFPQALVAQRVVPASQEQPAAPAIPDYATQTYGTAWDFDDGSFSGIDQWGNKPEYLRNKKVENGILSFDVVQDPWFIWGDMWGQVEATKQKVAIDLEKYPVLEMKVRQSFPSAQWELYGRVGNSSSLLHYDWNVSGTGWQRLRIDLRKDARWSGVLSALRLDTGQNVPEGHIEIDWVRLLAVTPVAHEAVETIGAPSAISTNCTLPNAPTNLEVGEATNLTARVLDSQGKPVTGQPVLIAVSADSGARLERSETQASLALSPLERRGLTNTRGELVVRYVAGPKTRSTATVIACTELINTAALAASAKVTTHAGPPHHYRVTPVKVAALKTDKLPLKVSAQLVDEFDNPVPGRRALRWTTDEPGKLTATQTKLSPQGHATATWTGEESKRWVYRVRVTDDQGLYGESAALCLLPSKPRTDPIVLGPNGYFRKGPDGPVWLPLGGFYANWCGLPRDGEEGRQLISFVEATEAQLDHWLAFLHSQGVTGLRFMLRAHTPRGMEPMDVIGRVNMPLFAKVLRYMDLARQYDIRFMLTIHEDYTKPAYFNPQALETFCLPQYAGEDLDKLPPYQRRFLRDRKLIGIIGEKYTDPDVMACQDQYTRELLGLLKDNPQLYSWEFENEMVDCPQSWARHMAKVIRSADPVTPICASHGGGGLHTGDPLWWAKKADIDFYTYHLYPHLGSTSKDIDYGCAADVLTAYGRMAGVCMFGETSGDEFEVYPKERDADRRYLMRDLIWFALVNGNPGCYFWNARGHEVAQFRLANQIVSGLDLKHWKRVAAPVAISVAHPWEEDKYYRSPQGLADYQMMGRYAQHYRSAGQDFDFTMGPGQTDLKEFKPVASSGPVSVPAGWQAAAAQSEAGEGLAYIRNFAGLRQWLYPNRANMFLRDRKAAPLTVTLRVAGKAAGIATDLDTGELKAFTIDREGRVDLGTSDHDWAMTWKSLK